VDSTGKVRVDCAISFQTAFENYQELGRSYVKLMFVFFFSFAMKVIVLVVS